ncbi:MAG: metal ABC transporter ATP-binding protein [Solirubrobacterales bacterium]|nr:metal ABC transporter ATP-binding protein [Solirubrobacterales bacterium]
MTEAVVIAAHAGLGYEGRTVLRGLEFEIPAGSRVGILGPNGGGKTTLFRALLGEITPLTGQLEVTVSTATVAQTDRSRLDYPVSALDVATMGSLARLPWWKKPGRAERERARQALGEVGLSDLAGRRFGDLSGGQRQRVLIARALTADADLLLMDEPFTGLDTTNENRLEELIDHLAASGRTVMIATHEVEQAERWDLVLCLNGEQISFGDPAVAISKPVLEATYGGHIVEIPGQPQLGVLPAHHHGEGH